MPLAALNRWLVAQAALWSLLLLAAAGMNVAGELPAWSLGTVAALMLVSFATLWRILGSGGRPADLVTLARFLGLVTALGLVAAGRPVDVWLWLLLVAVVAADLLDGWFARRFGGSEGGAVLDMETDQFATLGLAVLAACCAGSGTWTLLLPGFRYAYVAGLGLAGLPAHDPKPREGDNRRGRLICATVLVLLLAGLCPIVPSILAQVCTALAVLLLAYSFSSDFAFLWRRRGDARSGE
jgi:phosphatidylglycerophosphate synthase